MPGDLNSDDPNTLDAIGQVMTTRLEWTDLILPRQSMDQLQSIVSWVAHADQILDDPHLGRHINPGYRALFYGAPGTGKTLAATLLGKRVERAVHRIDLAMVVSKYIGETEKNLANLFDAASEQDWILFFDEADALFGARSNVGNSNDRFANQEVSYLLQRIEDFSGVVILASNLRSNIDDVFSRRFQSCVLFPNPDAEHRLKLWQNIFKDGDWLADDVDLNRLAQIHPVTGRDISNIVLHAMIHAMENGRKQVSSQDLDRAIQ